MSRESERRVEREMRRTADQASAATEAPAASKRASPTQFLGDVRSELRKVAWPGRKEVFSYTVLVLVVSTVLTLIVYGMDWVFRNAVVNTLAVISPLGG